MASKMYETALDLSEQAMDRLIEEAHERDVDESQIISEMLEDGLYLYEIEESTVSLKYVDPWGKMDKVLDYDGKVTPSERNVRVYRRLRDTFPPVTAGVEYSKTFTSGGGFNVDIQNSKNRNQVQSKNIINTFNRMVYQDDITQGLDAILDILLDDVFTVGSAAAEIVYDEYKTTPPVFEDFATRIKDPVQGTAQWETKVLDADEWKKMKGIVQLKIIDDAVLRLKPYRNPTTYKIEYWTVDEKGIDAKNQGISNEADKIPVPKLLPWQVLWLSWDRRGSNLYGKSLIEPVARTALALEDILKAIGISFKKWSDKKYFFVLGNDKTGRRWASPKIREFLHDLDQMTKHNGTGIPVPPGFKIEEIGGEIFEGGEVLDKFVSLIAGGMRYPRTFLEQGRTQEGDKAWLAWITTYSKNQKLLRRAIEHQLWKRHLYCIFGTKVPIKKQGVAEALREQEDVYIPKMSWRSEGKWHIQQKIEQLSRMLNVANPVSEDLKIEIELDVATTLGYSDFTMDNARKVLTNEQKLSVLESEMALEEVEIRMEVLEAWKASGEHLEMIPQIEGLGNPVPEALDPDSEESDEDDKLNDNRISKVDLEDAKLRGLEREKADPGDNPARPKPDANKRAIGGVSRPNEPTGSDSKRRQAKLKSKA
jgi:hypothetical protein